MSAASRTRVLLIGGRSGVGKTTSAAALHDLLVELDVRHALIEGDNLDLAHPAPHIAFPERGSPSAISRRCGSGTRSWGSRG